MPVAEYRPKFVAWTAILAQLPLQLFFTIWAGGFFGGVATSLLPRFAESAKGLGANLFVTIGLVVFVLFPIVTVGLKRLNYKNTTYNIHTDRIEIFEGFLTQHQKEVPLASVREVSLRRGVLQRLVGLGSIYLATQATGQGPGWSAFSLIGGASTFASGAMLLDLVEADVAYNLLRRLAEAQNERPAQVTR